MQKIGPLNAIVKNNVSDADTAFVILHGYGADATDLAPLSNVIDTPEPCNFYFLQAPLSLNLGHGFMGRAWFNIDQSELMQKVRQDFSEKTSPELIDTTNKVIESLKEILKTHKKIILGGFSQGAMITANTYLVSSLNEDSLPIEKLVLFSGARVNLDIWKQAIPTAKKIPFFQSHGQTDEVLPPKLGDGLFSFLNNHLNGKFVSFNDGHTIPNNVISQLNEWLRN